ncbi:protein TRACHEARY ELEMENT DIFFERENTIATION-RELATED 7-like [Pyrus communis]|uniref:protein TRACHEARY ELEMENT DIFFERENTIATION-RELATED 7-like n=1 Tax=Pyrus communis TaxID=23211 RepID=UPI0035C1659B
MANPNSYYFPFFPPPPPSPGANPPRHSTPPPPPSAKPPSQSTPPPTPSAKPPRPSIPPPPPSAKPPSHSTPPPPPSAKPPSQSTPPPTPSAKPPHPSIPPPPPPGAKPPSPSTPSPPHKPFRPPPPPHVRPPPPQLPPSPTPDNHPTVIVIVFISLGSVFFLAFLAVALLCYIKRRKKKTIQETDFIHIDKHRKIKEAIVEGPNGPQAVVLSVEDDVHIDEEIRKNETISHEGLHGKVKSSGVQSDTEIVNVNEHRKVKEDIVEGPHGSKAVVLTIDDDVHIDEIIRKNERVGKGLHGNAEAVNIDEPSTSSQIGQQ